MATSVKHTISILKGEDNWPTWRVQMKHLLLDLELWGYADGTEKLKGDEEDK